MANKRRKPDQWREIARSRGLILRRFPTSRGLDNIPKVTDTGSAAYRRLQRKLGAGFER